MKRFLIILFILINCIIIGRLTFLCLYKKDFYNKILIENNNRIIEGMTAPRGRILDINGNILVDNIGVKSIIYNKLNINTSDELKIADLLAENIDIDVNIEPFYLKYYFYLNNKDLIDDMLDKNIFKLYNERKISSKELLDNKLDLINDEMLKKVNKKSAYFYYLMNNGYAYEDKIIKTNITNEEYILVNKLNLKGIRTDITWERNYLYNSLLRDIFGSISSYKQGIPSEYKDEYLNKNYKLNDRVGISNLEYIYDEYLRGEKARYKVENNKLKLVSDYKRGKDIVLSIDINLQQEIEKILEPEMTKAKKNANSKYFNQSYIIVTNPQDGSIISLIGKKINEDNTFTDYSYYNVINSYNMGSSVKGATISVGYKNNLIEEKKKILDSCIKLYNNKPKCSWRSLGYIDDIRALKMSSNYYQYLIAIKLTGNQYKPNIKINANKDHFDEYRAVLKDYGLGNMTGIDLLKESSGIKSSIITDDLLLNMAVGHYDTYTPISLAQYINTIATGKRTQLSLLKSVLNHNGSIYYDKTNKIYNNAPIEEKYLNRIREGFRLVNYNGTAYSYTNHKFSSAGKTGTSDSYLDTDLDGNIDTFTINTSYVMYFPFEKPEISIAMVSPNISYKNKVSNYRYPINSKVMRKITDLFKLD
ncbi:MAG: penicillin-binding transpeptidase domain-containing protein [Bacilli bacterium]|nr:penicillin-binding transpeptidase domain-containing protein [Bacilli bacterium]